MTAHDSDCVVDAGAFGVVEFGDVALIRWINRRIRVISSSVG